MVTAAALICRQVAELRQNHRKRLSALCVCVLVEYSQIASSKDNKGVFWVCVRDLGGRSLATTHATGHTAKPFCELETHSLHLGIACGWL